MPFMSMIPWPFDDEDERLVASKPDIAPPPGQWDDTEPPKEGDEIFPESLPIGFLAARDRALGVAPLSRYEGWEARPTPRRGLDA